MGDPREHLSKSQQNKSRAEVYLRTFADDSPDWHVVLCFYSALHIVQCYLLTKGVRFSAENHAQRRQAIRESPELNPIRGKYRDLQDLSEEVRYNPSYCVRPEDHDNARAWLVAIDSFLLPRIKGRLK